MKRYEGKTLDDILNNVAKIKNCDVGDLTYYVVEEKSGILGIGRQVIAEVYALSDVENFIDEYLNNFFKGLELEVEVEVKRHNDAFYVKLNAENNAMLIGKGGTTLQAVNKVVRAAANSEFKRRFYVMVDINNYKSERYEKLKGIAKRAAISVQRTKVEVSLDPMPNDERKIIHQYLGEMKNIRTISEGEGNSRHLKIVYDNKKEN